MGTLHVGDIARIVIKPECIDPTLQVFKIRRLFLNVVFRRDLAQAMDASGFTGFGWTELLSFHRP